MLTPISLVPLLALLAPPAAAAPAGFTPTKAANGCQLYVGPDNGAIPAVRAECHWPEVDPQKLIELLAAYDKHDDYHASINTADTLRTEGDRALVRQTHTAPGISDRQVTVWMSRAAADGGTRFAWTKAPDQGQLLEDHVEVAVDDGSWTISAHPQGGASAVYELVYDPGGSVPGFLVKWFQGSGVVTLTGELRALAAR